MNTKLMFSSKTDDWATPQAFFDGLNADFYFQLDAAASEENHKCKFYYTEAVDGLKQPWAPCRTWCNPPYGRTVGQWVRKAFQEWLKGGLVVMLLPARTDTVWFHKWIYPFADVQFVRGRIKFGNSNNAAPFPSMVVVFDPAALADWDRKDLEALA